MLRFLIVETGKPIASMRRHGNFAHWIRTAAGLNRTQVAHCSVIDDAPLPAINGWAGVLITGSGAMVTERLGWSERTAQWLRDAAHAGVPLFGICYGHQLLAHALGGQVGFNPKGREMGSVQVRRNSDEHCDPIMGRAGENFWAQATHMQTVLSAPDDAVVLASSELDACQAFRWRKNVWGVQFHPEFSALHMRGYIAARQDALKQEGHCHRSLLESVRPTPVARKILRRFVRMALCNT